MDCDEYLKVFWRLGKRARVLGNGYFCPNLYANWRSTVFGVAFRICSYWIEIENYIHPDTNAVPLPGIALSQIGDYVISDSEK